MGARLAFNIEASAHSLFADPFVLGNTGLPNNLFHCADKDRSGTVVLHVGHYNWLIVPNEIVMTSSGVMMMKTFFEQESFNVPKRPVI